jgi:hypothetical protein
MTDMPDKIDMNQTPSSKKRLCSHHTKQGRPCRAWAIRGSDPPVCSIHARKTVSPGAPSGNTYALKHGYYSKTVRERLAAEDLEKIQDPALQGELAVGRLILADLFTYYFSPGLSFEQKLAAAPLINAILRTNTHIAVRVNPDIVDWDEILDNLKEEWGEI